MTKTKHNITLVISLILAIVMLASIFACASFHTPQTVEATETREAGLYQNGTLVKTWAELTGTNGAISVADGWLHVTKPTELVGELVCGSVENLTSLSFAFADCTSLTAIDVSKLDTSELGGKNSEAELTGAFMNCSSLRKLDLSTFSWEWAHSKYGHMFWMFAGCSSLEELNISSFDFSLSDYDTFGMLGISYEGFAFYADTIYANKVYYGKDQADPTTDEIASLEHRVEYLASYIECDWNDFFGEHAAKEVATAIFNTKIKKIIAPKVTGISGVIMLPCESGYKVDDTETVIYTLNQAIGKTIVAVGEEDSVPSTGVEANIAMIAIAFASVVGLVGVATKRKRVRKY